MDKIVIYDTETTNSTIWGSIIEVGAVVVDKNLKVHGIKGLRIADASIMPTLVSGNTNAVCMMIGERCADFILNN